MWDGGEGGCGVGEYPACTFASGKCSSYDSSPEKNTPDPSLSPYSSSLPRHCPLIDYLRTFKGRIWGGCWGGVMCEKQQRITDSGLRTQNLQSIELMIGVPRFPSNNKEEIVGLFVCHRNYSALLMSGLQAVETAVSRVQALPTSKCLLF